MQGKLSEFDLYGILLLATAGMRTGGLLLRRGDETVEVFLKTATWCTRPRLSVTEKRLFITRSCGMRVSSLYKLIGARLPGQFREAPNRS